MVATTRKNNSSRPKALAPETPAEAIAESIHAPETHQSEKGVDRALRPTTLAEYVGQAELRRQLTIYLQAAIQRGDALDHVLLFGPPGLGKTTLAQIIAHELGVKIRITSGPVLERPGDLAAMLTQLEENEVLFIDEIHRLPVSVEEILYPAMEDFRLDIVIGEGTQAKSISVPLPAFTLIGATTRAGSLSAPLRDRFGITGRLEFYSPEDLARIVERSSTLLACNMSEESAREVAKRARGTPRIANRMLRRVRDYAQVHGATPGSITLADANDALAMLGVDESGLDALDRKLLFAIKDLFGGGPVGIDTLSTALGESRDTVEDAVEPYLVQQGYLQRTPRGRVLTERGHEAVD